MEYFTIIDQLFTTQDHSDNLNIFARPLYRSLERNTMPVFDHISSRWAKTEEDASTRTFIQRSNSTGDQCRSARINISNASSNLDAFGSTHKIGHRSKKFVAPGFAEPDRIVTQFICNLDLFYNLVPCSREIWRISDQSNTATVCSCHASIHL